MMRIIKSTAIILASVAIVAGATFAAWSDTATIDSVTFSSGNLDLKIDSSSDSGTQTWSDGFTAPANFVTNLYPGFPIDPISEHNWQVIDLKNEGTAPGNLTVKFKRTSSWNELSGELYFELYAYDNNDGFDSEAEPNAKGTLDALNNIIQNLNYPILPGEDMAFRLVWTVPSTAGNEIQGDSITFDVIFDLIQGE